MKESPGADWRPDASLEAMRARAQMLCALRGFFEERAVLEVDTPLLCAGTVTDPHIEPLTSGDRWLQTSPEYAMKRLLAADSGPVYQVCKAFRQGEQGVRHNPEFTLLEWYRPDFALPDLMEEVAALLDVLLEPAPHQVLGYREAFQSHLGIDPMGASTGELESLARSRIDIREPLADRDAWLDLLMSHLVEPELAKLGRVFLHGYPPSQAALARTVTRDGQEVAERFELYVNGLEIANGYRELTDAREQRERFDRDNALRERHRRETRPLDLRLLAALEAGLPDCAGVALGLDRLLMVKLGASQLKEVLAFDWASA